MHSRAFGVEETPDGSVDGIEAVAETTAASVSPVGSANRTSALDFESSNSGWKGRGVVPTTLGVATLVFPVAAYFWFIDRFSVNVPYWDQWDDIKLIRHWYIGGLSFSDLWASHGDHRILFPNLIVLGLAKFTHFNVTVEEYLSALMLVGSAVLVIAAHKRRSRSTPILWYLPVMLLLFSFVQFMNTLWGFQMAWYLVTLSLVTTLYILDRPILTHVAFFAAIVAAVVASYSSLQGLTVWPVGLVLLYLRRRSAHRLIVWCALAVAATMLYFYDWKPGGSSKPTYIFTHPIHSLKFFLFLIGSVLGVQKTTHPAAEVAFGGVLVAVSIVLVVWCWRRDEWTGRPFTVALVLYGLLFGLSITVGRAWSGLYAPSRYAACGLFILAGCYLTLLERLEEKRRSDPKVVTATGAVAHPDGGRRGWGIIPTTCWIVIAVGIALEIVFGTGHGFASAKTWSQAQMQVADVTVNYQKASPDLLGDILGYNNEFGSRTLSEFMAAHRLSVFGTADSSYYASIGLLPALTAVETTVVVPTNGAILNGVHVLDATALDASGVRSVRFLATDSSHHFSFAVAGKLTTYGWVVAWNTRTAPNGRYELVSVAIGYGSRRSQSASVNITVRN